MRRWGIVGGIGVLVMGLAVAVTVRGVLPEGLGPLDDIDWYGVQGIGA